MTATDTDPRLDQLRQQIAQANERIRDLAGERYAAHERADHLAGELASVVTERDRSLAAASKRISDLCDERNDALRQANDYATREFDMRQERDRIAGDLRAIDEQCDQLADELAAALEEQDRACDRLACEQRRAAAALAELHQARTAFITEQRAHQATTDEAAAQVATLTSQCARLEAALTYAIDQHARDGARIVALELERVILLHRLDTVRVACDC